MTVLLCDILERCNDLGVCVCACGGVRVCVYITSARSSLDGSYKEFQGGELNFSMLTKKCFNLWNDFHAITFHHLIVLLCVYLAASAQVDFANCSLFVNIHELSNCGEMS